MILRRPRRKRQGRRSMEIGEEGEYKHGKVVDVVKSDSFNGVYFQHLQLDLILIIDNSSD